MVPMIQADSLQKLTDWKLLAVQKMDTVFHTLAHQAGVAAEHFWPIFIRQQFVDALTNIVGWIVPFVLWLILVLGLRKWLKKHPQWRVGYHSEDSEEFIGCASLMVLGVSGVGLLMGFWSSVVPSLAQLLNPEYYAVQAVFKLIKP